MTSPEEERAREAATALAAEMARHFGVHHHCDKCVDRITRALLAHGLAERRAAVEQCEAIAVDYLDRMTRAAAKPHPVTGRQPNEIAVCKADAAETILAHIRALIPPLSPAAGKEE